mmetsp:Transcript_127908/g.355965  ORF Transcript_127908/g.355965 Transcript_127908/m.355965 type:complete len:220 (+) Transcript_127908:458-1117(+)
MPMEGEPKRDRLARSLQPQPWHHMTRMQDTKCPAIVTLAPKEFGLQPAVLEGGAEGPQHVLPVLVHPTGRADAPRAIEGQVGMPRFASGAVGSPVLLQCRLSHPAGGGDVLALRHHGQGCRHTVVCRRRQHQTLWQSCCRKHRAPNTAKEVRIVNHHEVVVELASGGGNLSSRIEIGDAEVHPLLRRRDLEEGVTPEHGPVARGRCHLIGAEEEHLAEE